MSELRGDSVNKSAHRRRLLPVLQGRSEGAVERKHQNISAILLEAGVPYIDGYKPLRNYQYRLRESVLQRLETSAPLRRTVEDHVRRPVDAPEVEDLLGIMEDPPEPSGDGSHISEEPPDSRWYASARPNYLEMEARNRSVGRTGEELVLRYEKARLLRDGCNHLSDRVEQVSETVGDWKGFDIHSYESSGQDRLIEVKTTAYGKDTPFFVTRNELTVSLRSASSYHLYRVFRIRRGPRLFCLRGSLDDVCNLDPVQFRGWVA